MGYSAVFNMRLLIWGQIAEILASPVEEHGASVSDPTRNSVRGFLSPRLEPDPKSISRNP